MEWSFDNINEYVSAIDYMLMALLFHVLAKRANTTVQFFNSPPRRLLKIVRYSVLPFYFQYIEKVSIQ